MKRTFNFDSGFTMPVEITQELNSKTGTLGPFRVGRYSTVGKS